MEDAATTTTLERPAVTTATGGTPAGHAVAPLGRPRGVLALFTVASFVGSGLLFLVQPLVTRLLTPRLGGSPAVWNTAMVFFQATLLVGYALAHLGTRRPVIRQVRTQVVVVALPVLVLPLAVPGDWRLPEGTPPAAWALGVLVVVVGLPFLALSTASPTFQRWFSLSGHPQGDDPYFLYAAGNAGSLLALLAYPLLLDPHLSVSAQSRLWSLGYLGFVGLTVACGLVLRRHGALAWTTPGPGAGRPPGTLRLDHRHRARIVALAFVPSLLLVAVTRHISTDVASIPLLWVLPLALYLLSFVIAFGRTPDRIVRSAGVGVAVLAVPLAAAFARSGGSSWPAALPHLAFFTAAAVLTHARLATIRPPADRLTEFYLWLSVGGVLGGVAGALVAPMAFDTVLEYPLAVGLAVALCPPLWRRRRPRAALVAAVAVGLSAGWWVLDQATDAGGERLAVVLFTLTGALALTLGSRRVLTLTVAAVLVIGTLTAAAPTRHVERTFFGVHRVWEDGRGRRVLAHGTTAHGLQDPTRPDVPLAYYHPDGPVGDVFAAQASAVPLAVGVVGLGTGAIAAYGRTGGTMTFYEIDPAVADIASDPTLFTYLADAEARTRVVLGDGRLSLQDTDETYDLVVVDAFSSDAIPVHLLTAEAMAGYLERLRAGGLVAVHLSNRYFDLAPALARTATALGLGGRQRIDAPDAATQADGRWASNWVVLAPSGSSLAALSDEAGWRDLPRPEGRLWTDDYADVLGALDP